MPSFFFGVGDGKLSKAEIKRRSEIAERHGVAFNVVHGKQGNCVCGWGCRLDTCPILHYWFSVPSSGTYADDNVRRAVETELRR